MKVIIKNIGLVITGDLEKPFFDTSSIVIEDGVILKLKTTKNESADIVIDAKDNVLMPGLIDSHAHPFIGEWTPRQHSMSWTQHYLSAGVTTLVSVGEAHCPGRPRDAAGTKALAILSAKSSKNYRPGNLKVKGGALILEEGLTENDFFECAQNGVERVGEIGIGSVNSPDVGRPMVELAKKYGLKTMVHTGGTSLPGSAVMDYDTIMQIGPDLLCHLNGGSIPMPLADIKKSVVETNCYFEVARIGNPNYGIIIANYAKLYNSLHRLMLGNDAPSGAGIFPWGIWQLISFLSSFSDLEPEESIAAATGNTSRFYNLESGFITEGYSADLLLIDTPANYSDVSVLKMFKNGNVPAINLVMIDGKILRTADDALIKSKRMPEIVR